MDRHKDTTSRAEHDARARGDIAETFGDGHTKTPPAEIPVKSNPTEINRKKAAAIDALAEAELGNAVPVPPNEADLKETARVTADRLRDAERKRTNPRNVPQARVRVTAIKAGYYNDGYREPGDTFFMVVEVLADDHADRATATAHDGGPLRLPTWVVLATDTIDGIENYTVLDTYVS